VAQRIRTVDFLPEIFQTAANKQFLSATLDQLVQDPKLKPTQGFIGRRVGPGVNPYDNYVLEPTKTRTDYQLEPGICKLLPNTNTVERSVTYPGLVDSVAVQGGNVSRQDRLWSAEYYSFDPFIDMDKFVNFSQYYWLPNGPDSVDVFSGAVPITDNFDVTRNSDGYTISGAFGTNPTITLVRQGQYTFDVQQPGYKFWIQSVPGVNGTLPFAQNQSSREVLGVINNGDDAGTITFNVPAKNAQNFYYQLLDEGNVDFATNLQFDQINNVYYSQFIAQYGGLDGIKDIDGRTLIFTNDGNDGWDYTSQFSANGQGYDETLYDQTVPITLNSQRYSVWRVTLVYDDALNPFISLSVVKPLPNLSKVLINYGAQNAGKFYYKDAEGYFQLQPLITADLDILYYQDSVNPNAFGIIRLVDQAGDQTLDISEILGKKNYTSPNGVVFSNGLKVQFEGNTLPAEYSGNEYYVEGVGTAITLTPTDRLITPETYTRSTSIPYDSTPYDAEPYDQSLNAPLDPDYITMNRSSIDYNAWSRSNRWFHIDIIFASASYNNTSPLLDNEFRAKRPILEFRKNLKLFNSGTIGLEPVDIIDFRATDAFSTINGTIGYSVDGYTFINGTRVIFAADRDPKVRDKIYEVKFVSPDGGTPVIDLQPADLNSPELKYDDSVVILSGITQQGLTYRFDGATWIKAQHKNSINQPPLFDVFDENGVSFGDRLAYPSTNFTGTKLFSYAIGPGATDPILDQPLKYLSINNVGDIVFDNNLYLDSFIYTKDTVSVTLPIDQGIVRQYLNRTDYIKLLGWQTADNNVTSRQSFSFTYDGNPLVLDVPVDTTSMGIPLKVFVGAVFVEPSAYTFSLNDNGGTTIQFVNPPAAGSLVEVSVVSQVASEVGFYSVPLNLQNNAINAGVPTLTLGTVRNHYGTICQNLSNFSGTINGANNTRDLGNIIPYGEIILQQGAPLTLAGNFLNNPAYNIFRSLDFNAREYEKYKNVLMDTVANNDFQNMSAAEILDQCMANINTGRSNMAPFYWTDTVPTGTCDITNYTITPLTTNEFDTLYTYDFTSANYKGILVYLNDNILLGNGLEYTVSENGPRITVHVPLAIGDVLTIKEYTVTYGNFVPATPTKLGLYDSYVPQKYLDTTYVTPTMVIQGHDGSITVAFGDIRDDILLEFEKRIYNNLKLKNNPVPLTFDDVSPGQFRTTEYTQAEITEILSTSFLIWCGTNKLNYREQDYIGNNEFTWNYSSSENKLNGTTLLGAWRGIYNYFYDTDRPHTHPWEMLGFSQKPAWWDDQYGPGPYTSGNLVLWDDLEAGLVNDPVAPYVIEKYKRPGLTSVVPSSSEGALLPPFPVMVGEYDVNSFRKSWVVGDGGPTESAWRKSSAWPFAVQRLLALTKPAEYFALLADRDLYRFNVEFDQFLYNNRNRLQPGELEIYGNGVPKHSYINFIVDYNRQTGLDSTNDLKIELENIDVRLCYRMASFSDKKYLKIFTEKSSPNSLNSSLLLPDESYQLLLYQNPTIETVVYSSVVIQKTLLGWTVFGYSTTAPYFDVLVSIPNGNYRTISVADTVVKVATDYTDNVVQVPYGYEFTSIASVVDFLVSYGELKSRQGFVFDDRENGKTLDWNQMAQEFLYWNSQGWGPGSLINLNPAANLLTIVKPGLVAESLSVNLPEDILLDQNKKPFQSQDYVVERQGNELKLLAINNSTFSYIIVKFTQYENLIVFDNKSIFNDLVYDPASGARQSRLLLVGYTTYDWNGTLDAQGFIVNQDNIGTWVPNRGYPKGQIVRYKDSYWSAVTVIPPSASFDFSKWLKSDYQSIQKGLLPNLATKAEQTRNYYDINAANLETDADLLSFALIGFQPRQYMQNLNLDDISQVNIYSQFIGLKGTRQATDIFTKANLGKEVAEYTIFENWAIQRALYGANANRRYFELRLNAALLQANPSVVQIIYPQQPSRANQTILFEDIWKTSYPFTSPDILPTTLLDVTDVQLPSAGYVNYDDVDVKVFEFSDLTPIIDDIENIVVGSSFWVAKDNSHNWNIYRSNLAAAEPIAVKDSLNGRCTMTFNGFHGLAKNQLIIIKYFDENNSLIGGIKVNGAYRVLDVPSLTTVIIELSLGGRVTTIESEGICFTLESMRVAQASDVSNLSYSSSLLTGNQAWVDNDGTGNWVVLEKTSPFESFTTIQPNPAELNSRFGTAVAQGFGGFGALVGAPGYNNEIGACYALLKSNSSSYVIGYTFEPGANNFIGFGRSVAAGGLEWGVAGAPDSWAKQGYAVAIKRDSTSGTFRQAQLFSEAPYRLYTATGDGSTTTFDPSGSFTVEDPQQLGVVVDDVVQEYGTDWTYSAPNVVFTVAPNLNTDINIFLYDENGYSCAVSSDDRWMYIGAPSGNRIYCYNQVTVQNQVKTFIGDGSTSSYLISDVIKVDQDSADGGIGSLQIGVVVNNIPKTLDVDWVFDGDYVAFTTAPNTGDRIRITRKQSITYFPTGSQFEFDVQELYTITDAITSFSVYVNDVLQRPNMDYSYDSVGKTITFTTVAPTGTVLINSETYWTLVDYFDMPDAQTFARFGHSLTTTSDGRQITVGARNQTVDGQVDAGSVYLIDRSVERFTVTDSTVTSYTTVRNFNGPVTVKVNNQFLIPDTYNNNGEFSSDGINTVTISVPLNVGDFIEIENNTFKLVQEIASNNNAEYSLFGSAVDQCPTNCSLYIGKPNDSALAPQAGSVERWVNQNRLYGTLTGTVSDPTLTPGDTIRINDVDVFVSTPASWTSAVSWSANTFVINGLDLYRSRIAVPAGVAISNTDYWQSTSWVDLFVKDIIDADIPNVTASNNNEKITINIVNSVAAEEFSQLILLPGLGDAFYDLGIEPMYYAQTLTSPQATNYAHFGQSVNISSTGLTLVVGAPQGTSQLPTTFDNGTTFFDSKATQFFGLLPNSGVAYTYDLLLSANPSIYNPSKFVFGQQIYNNNLNALDEFGTSVDYYNGILLVGAPQDDLGDSVGDYGIVGQFNNPDKLPAWLPVYRQQPIVDVKNINSVFTYNLVGSNYITYFDFIDPLQGKILGAAKQNIDYLGSYDPAGYNTGVINNYGQTWTGEHVGEIWWDLTNARFIDYHQDTLEYASRRWGQLFPGSSIDVYQWIQSDVPPSQYQGPGTIYSETSYSTSSRLDADGLFVAEYYFWVKGLVYVDTNKNKTLSVAAIAQYIENPRSSGIPYVALLSPSAVALYNAKTILQAEDTVIHIEFDQIPNSDNVHVEYDLVAAGDPDSFLGAGLYRKMLDSFCGEDTLGNKVPDPTLGPADRYGVYFRPRQSFFVDRFLALQNYLTRANKIIARFPVSESRDFSLLNSAEPEPNQASGLWDKRVLTHDELSYQNLRSVPVGYRYLVATDSTVDGLWTIYTLQENGTLLLTRVQNYDTRMYWNYINWVAPGYNPNTRPVAEVANYSQLSLLTVEEGQSVKVTRNSFGKYEIYQWINSEWIRVVLESGTIEFSSELWDYAEGRFGFDIEVFDSQRFDQFPGTETRQVLKAINEELLVDELQIFRNELLLLVFEYILTEEQSPDWLFKTSLIDVVHKIRDLEPYQILRQDNQDFVLDYIREVKPYHVKIKDFALRYDGNDTYPGSVSDFDCPAFYDSALGTFIDPILDDGDPPLDPNSSFPSTSEIWQQWPWSQWYENYTLSIESVEVINGGTGYTVAPEVIVTGDAVVEAEIVAKINSAGQVIELIVVNPGSGYLTTAMLSITGGNGTGARAVAIMGNGLVRSITTTIKYDRFEYVSQVVDWEANTAYPANQLVRHNAQVWSANSAINSGPIFDPDQFTEVDAASLAAADRVIGYYTPDINEPGRKLSQVMVGIDYPGVQVQGPGFNQNPGFDVGNYDINPYDNLSYGPEGRPTYDPAILDAIYQSEFTDTYLGSLPPPAYGGDPQDTRSTGVEIDGGAFIDTYASHAPEELVPGSTFDTLDFRVLTRPGSDWGGDGHGFHIDSTQIYFEDTIIDFSEAMAHPVAVRVINVTNRVSLIPQINYTVDWPTRTVTVTSGANPGDIVNALCFGIGGGSQLLKQDYPGNEIGNELTVPVAFDEIYEMAIQVNGELITDYTFTANPNGYSTDINFVNTYSNNDWVVVTVLGTTTPQKSWSYPLTQYFVYDGSTDTYNLTNSLQGTNPIDLIVERDGERLRPAETVAYVGDGSSLGPYFLPTRGGINLDLVSDNDVVVYVDNELQTLSIDYDVSPPDLSTVRWIDFTTPPPAGSTIKIALTTAADYILLGNQLVLRVGAAMNATIAVTTWNDTQEQRLLTQVFQGPTQVGVSVDEPYDTEPFDSGAANYDPGTFDYGVGIVQDTNIFDTGRPILSTERLWVTRNGYRLSAGLDFTVDGTNVILSGGIVGPADVIVITSFAQTVVPEAEEFRIFQDMLGNQKIYRVLDMQSTYLTTQLNPGDSEIYVSDASALSQPNPSQNIFGVIMIDGERITYRERDTSNNVLSGLRRGVAGTAIASHDVNATVTDAGFGELLPSQYQMTEKSSVFKGDGTTTEFTTDFGYSNTIEVKQGGTIRVYEGLNIGTLEERPLSTYSVASIEPIKIVLNDVPAAGRVIQITYTTPLGVTTVVNFPTTGATSTYTTEINASTLTLSPASYTVTNLGPVTVVLNTPLLEKRILIIQDLNASEFFVSDGTTTTYETTISLVRPIQVTVGGYLLEQTDYTVSSIDPVVVILDTPPPDNIDIKVFIKQARVMYEQGIDTASNGQPLQEQNTEAALFIKGSA